VSLSNNDNISSSPLELKSSLEKNKDQEINNEIKQDSMEAVVLRKNSSDRKDEEKTDNFESTIN